MPKSLILAVTFALCLGSPAAAQTYFFDTWAPRTFEGVSAYNELAPPIGPATATITVNYADTLTHVSPYVFGNNAPAWNGRIHTNTTMMRHLRNARISVLRFPGGSWGDEYFWNARNASNLPGDLGPMWSSGDTGGIAYDDGWKMTPSDFYTTLDALGSEAIMIVNYGYARYGTSADPVAEAAHLAADWVRDVNIRQGLGIKYWEIGNEVFGSWEAGNTVPDKGAVSGSEYGRNFRVFVDSMKAVDPTIKIGAVTVDWENDSGRWNQRMFPQIRDHADFLIVHNYFTPWPWTNLSPEDVFDTAYLVGDVAERVRGEWQTYSGKQPIPIVLTEFNIRAVNLNYETGHLNSLFFATVLGEIIKHRYAMANMWDLKNGSFDNGQDHGMLSPGNEPGVTENSPHGSFFPFYYYTRLFGDVMVASEVSNANLYAYASRFSSGETGLVIVNPTANDEVVRLDLQHLNLGERYYWYQVQNDDPNGRKVSINNVWGTQAGSGPNSYESVLPFSAMMSGGVVIDAKKYSATYLLVEAEQGTRVGVEASDTPAAALAVDLYPNPARDRVRVRVTGGQPDEVQVSVFDLAGRLRLAEAPATMLPGSHEITLDVSSLPAGLYLCEVRLASGGRMVRKLAVVR